MLRKRLALLALCLVVAGCTGGAFPGAPAGFLVEPTRAHIEAMAELLPPQMAMELRQYFKKHPKVWGLEVHVKDTCPFITWWPAYLKYQSGQMSDLEWAEFLHEFFEAKHDDEGHCDCDELLGIVKPAPAPEPVAPPAPKPDAPPAADPPDKDDDDRDDAIKELFKKWLKERAPDLPEIRPK